MRQSKFDIFYTKHVVKSPLVFWGFIVIGTIVFLWLTLTNKANIMKSLDAKFYGSNGTYTIEFPDQIPEATSGYIYVDRNEAMIPVEYVPVSEKEVKIVSKNDLPFPDESEIKIDVVDREVSLLYLIFIEGGGT